jgi:hypothetical protein
MSNWNQDGKSSWVWKLILIIAGVIAAMLLWNAYSRRSSKQDKNDPA